MQHSNIWHLKQFKVMYFAFVGLIVVSLNFLLNDALHKKIHTSGQQLVKQIYDLNLAPSINNEVLAALVKSEGFMLKPEVPAEHFKHLVSVEHDVFTYKTLSLSIYHYSAWVKQGYLFALLNLVIIGAACWFYCWWSLLKEAPTKAAQKALIKSPKLIKQKYEEGGVTKPVKNCELSSLYGVSLASHSLFLLIEYTCNFDKNTDKEATFKVAIVKSFPELKCVSVELLNTHYLGVTLQNVSVAQLDRDIERVHKAVFLLCRNHQKTIIRKNIKVGACNYRLGADKVTVYQLAKSALTLSQSSLLQHCHRLPLNHSQDTQLSSEQVIENIKKNKFILFFQPLFELSTGDILQHEVLMRVRHSQHGLLAARYFINQHYSNQDALILDKAVIGQVKKLMLSEASALIVSINLHPNNWFNNEFWEWLPSQLTELKLNAKLQFEISEADFFAHRNSITKPLNIIRQSSSQLVIDNVKSSEKIASLVEYSEVCAIKLSYELVHLLNEKPDNQKQITKIVESARYLNLPVFAVGVETQKELFMLAKLGVVGAQGFYFSEPLQEFTHAVFH
ncbi:EAL domain-containing protein [Pseudoalteromonas sp. MMG007]|uniref:EAL domain-containing protein n=1 Tax=Pseudoalteromonas sp. MMG007 TaxID=2822684 RepID=UPI001B36B289|nr:EAL domain-containing protein [Pseudoalteromonas sp. MMG007]MBQ4858360.1 EAL domain-containing protein [Pseudoalteromonas sp. MMG007]